MIGRDPRTVSRAQRLADSIVRACALAPPVNVERLVGEIADVREARLADTGLDAVLFGLQTNVRPVLLLREDVPATRRAFTLAHELGHLSMAWHRGTLSCEIGQGGLPEAVGMDIAPAASNLEREANEFASRLLLPREYFETLSGLDLGRMLEASERTGLSAEAAIYSLASHLEPGHFLILLDYSGLFVEKFAQSFGTVSLGIRRGVEVDFERLAGLAAQTGSVWFRGSHIFWGSLISSMELVRGDENWRKLLSRVARDFDFDPNPSSKDMQSLNGVASSAHSRVGHENLEVLAQRIKQAFQVHQRYAALVRHSDFDAFVSRRAEAFAAGKRRSKGASK